MRVLISHLHAYLYVLKEHNEKDMTYKMFSRQSLTDSLLDQIFSIDLYYVNAFQNAASTMETSAVAAENIARLIVSRLSGYQPLKLYGVKTSTSDLNLQRTS
ncbi:hypothetical protein LXL04_033465 [Taraxacum kok-saghyz]